MAAPPLLLLQDIHLTFGGTPLIEGAELSVSSGERLCLVGRNGSGKSTLLRIAAGLVECDRGTRFVQPVPRGHSAFAYAFRGEGQFGVGGDFGYRGDLDGALLHAPQLAVFGDGDEVRVEADASPVRFLLVSGKPLGEPIARYGPFVMNTREEIMQAMEDFNAGRMGVAPPTAR